MFRSLVGDWKHLSPPPPVKDGGFFQLAMHMALECSDLWSVHVLGCPQKAVLFPLKVGELETTNDHHEDTFHIGFYQALHRQRTYPICLLCMKSRGKSNKINSNA